MPSYQPWVVLLVAFIGNCSGWLFCFNRINSTGLARRHTKRIEKIFVACCFSLPSLVLIIDWDSIQRWMLAAQWWPNQTILFSPWAISSFVCLAVLGPSWIQSRCGLRGSPNLLSETMVTHHVGNQLPAGSAGDRLTKLLDSIPFNEISRLEVNHKQLRLLRHLPAAEGFKICHISDLHFTGQLNIDHYQFVVDRVLEFEADLIAITGDIIDYARCLPWLEPVLGRLQARYGCLFLLGNHDRRLSDVDEPARILSQLGHVDTGKRDVLIHTPTMRISVSGNERPWLERHDCAGQSNLAGVSQDTTRAFPELRLGLSHSPDQLPWARGLALDLLLAGHTHGGQVRFPLIGPIVAPSRYGSRFASGVFARAPTLMHVSRGIAGTHPLRWRCLPEVSLLTLHS